jgi:hypothetical protein
MNKLLEIINEELRIFETEIDPHAVDRLKERLDKMSSNGDITPEEYGNIKKNLDDVLAFDFDSRDYGILLGTFTPNPKSSLYTIKNPQDMGTPFYTINLPDKNEILKDSTGDEFWGIVRGNVLKTVMLRKRKQRQFAGEKRTASGEQGKGGLGVDVIISNFSEHLAALEREKLIQKEKEQVKFKLAEKTIRINGVLWVIDDVQQRIYKKNDPNTFVLFNDVLDYPHWDDRTKEEILKRLG